MIHQQKAKKMFDLGHHLNLLKNKKGFTAKELSEMSGVPLSTVNRILSGQTPDPGYSTVCKLLDILDPDGSYSNKKLMKATDFDPYHEMFVFYESELKQCDKWIKILLGTLLTITVTCLALLFINVLFR